MKPALSCAALLLLICATAFAADRSSATQQYLNLPLAFEQNRGQTNAEVRYLARTSVATVFLTPREIVVELAAKVTQPNSATVVRLAWDGAASSPLISGESQQAGTANYFRGQDPAHWQTAIPTYAQVRYHDLYPGIDLVFHGRQQQLEYDYIVSSRADPAKIRLRMEGAALSIDRQGDLMLGLGAGEVRQRRPFAYQIIDGSRRRVNVDYMLLSENRVGLKIGAYDHSRELVIDPYLSYSTLLGGSGGDSAAAITVDSYGRAYVTGSTFSPDFPTKNAYQSTTNAEPDPTAFVTKFWATGGGLIYSTYLGGGSSTSGTGIAIDSGGYAYVVGDTSSPTFPTTSGAFQTSITGQENAFITKLSPSGSSLVYSTYLGGSGTDTANGMALDSSHRVYVAGSTTSANFPTKSAAQVNLRGAVNAFVARLNADGASLSYSTYLGGNNADVASAIAIDGTGHAFVTGSTNSTTFPVTSGAFQKMLHTQCTAGFDSDAFVTKLWATGAGFIYSTYLGGCSEDGGHAIAVDGYGRAYVAGTTGSPDFPTTSGAYKRTAPGGGDVFVTRLNSSGSGLSYSTYLGGSGDDTAWGIAIDGTYHAYVTGDTYSSNYPLVSPLQTYGSAFVTKLWASGGGLIFSTRIGGTSAGAGADTGFGIKLDGSGAIYVCGQTSSTDFKTTTGAFQRTLKGGEDAFIVKIHQ